MPLPGAPKGLKTALLALLEGPAKSYVHTVGPKQHQGAPLRGHYDSHTLRHGFDSFGGFLGPEMLPFGLSHQDRAPQNFGPNFFLTI